MRSIKCLKSFVSEHLGKLNMLNSLKNWTAGFPWYCFITLKKIECEIVCLSVLEILEVLVNTLNAYSKYSLRNRKNFSHTIQLQLYKKHKTFSNFFAPYMKSASNVEYFGEKDDPHPLCIFQIRDCKRCR